MMTFQVLENSKKNLLAQASFSYFSWKIKVITVKRLARIGVFLRKVFGKLYFESTKNEPKFRNWLYLWNKNS